MWIKVTVETSEGADVGTRVGERELEDPKAKDKRKNGSHPTTNAGTEKDKASRSTNKSMVGMMDKETEMNISGTRNKEKENERNRVARRKEKTHGVTKHGEKIYRLCGCGHLMEHGTKHGKKHGKMHRR